MIRKPLLAMFASCMLLASGTLFAADAAAPAAAPAATEAPAAPPPAPVAPTISVDKTAINNGGTIAISGKAEPGKVGFQQISKFARAAHGIQILNAQHNLAAAAFGRKPRQQAAAQVAQVHPPAGAWRIAPDCAAHSSV